VSSAAITAAVAQTLARRTAASVCVVDANFGAPTLHRHFNLAPRDGFAEALTGHAPLVAATLQVDSHLWLLPAGRAPVTDSLASDAVRGRLAHFMAEFDYVLIDVEPMGDAASVSGVVPLLTGVILVLGADSTRREAARRAAQTLTNWGTSPLGAVLTDRRFPIPETLYRHL
jgi:Mrp family chromosome partitioning ATPase